jgi:hypothetical protein
MTPEEYEEQRKEIARGVIDAGHKFAAGAGATFSKEEVAEIYLTLIVELLGDEGRYAGAAVALRHLADRLERQAPPAVGVH